MELVLSAFLLSCGFALAGYFLSQGWATAVKTKYDTARSWEAAANRVVTLIEQELSNRRTDSKDSKKVTEPLPPVPVELLTLAGKWGSGERPDEWATQDTIKSLQEAYVETGNWEKAAERVGLFN